MTWKLSVELGETEFSGGRITGPLLSMTDFARLLFLVALLLLLWLPRIAATIAGIASLLCLPLSLLLLAPGPFRRVVGGEWSEPLQSNFFLSKWTAGWFIALAITLTFSAAILLRPTPKRGKEVTSAAK